MLEAATAAQGGIVRAGPWRASLQAAEVDATWLTAARGPDGQLQVGWLPERAWGPAWINYTQLEIEHYQAFRQNVAVDIAWPNSAVLWTARRMTSPEETAALQAQAWLTTLHMLALRQGGLMLHGASMRLGESAVVVIGPSGAGKSTLARRFPLQTIHDDVTLVARANDRWQVWYQDADRPPPQPQPDQTPLAAIFYLGSERSKSQVRRLPVGRAMDLLAEQTYFSGGKATPLLAGAMAELLAGVPIYELTHCLTDDVEQLRQLLTDPERLVAAGA